MSANVVSLTGGEAIPGEPVADVIEMLEGLLEKAKRGEIVAIACATVVPGGSLGSEWAAAAWNRWHLLATLEMATHRYKAYVMREADDE